MIDITGRSQKNCPRMLLTRQFASNVTDDHAVNAIYDSPIWYALFIKKSEDGVAVMVLFEREKLGAYDGTAKKSDAVSKSLICHLDFASWTCSHLSCITVTLFSVSMIICQFGSNVAEDPVENAIGYSPILDALEEVAVKALFGSKREARCF